MLRRRSSGVAKFSQHMLGKAIDFYIPGVPLEQLRAAGLRAQRGGVGFYPTSGAPFVHMDTGSVRHWPRMPEAQLASVLSKGQLHSASASDGAQRSRMPGLLARLFGGGRDEAQDAATAAAPAPVKVAAISRKPAAAPEARSEKPSAVSVAESRVEKVAMVPFPPAKPARPASNSHPRWQSRPPSRPRPTRSPPPRPSLRPSRLVMRSRPRRRNPRARHERQARLRGRTSRRTTSSTSAAIGRDCRAPSRRTRRKLRARRRLQRRGVRSPAPLRRRGRSPIVATASL